MTPTVSPLLVALIFAGGGMAGALGALLGLGGGVFLVPFLTLVLHMPITVAVPISLTTVIATSSAVSGGRKARELINVRLGMLLEVATAAGGLAGGLTARMLSPAALHLLFGLVTAGSGVTMLGRLGRRNVSLDPALDPGRLGGRFHEEESGGVVTYRVHRLPIALAASFVAGQVSTLLGVGGGIIKVPVLNAWCGVPLRAAAATSAFMIGVTATPGAVIYYMRGEIIPAFAAAAVLGVRLGSWVGLRIGSRASSHWLKLMMAVVLFVVAALMFVRAD